ncbi:hypothetical protein llap_5092 [Limosa lapponica baueri]|uniref:Uncharacterized protein n=1 Tax=Limosa lapponica baueri TaxID=1758121 RepID=A0A2I0UEZ5_LIMLA|nr:hypothetical protein llap_5092 [Limosa lapponica baueri]
MPPLRRVPFAPRGSGHELCLSPGTGSEVFAKDTLLTAKIANIWICKASAHTEPPKICMVFFLYKIKTLAFINIIWIKRAESVGICSQHLEFGPGQLTDYMFCKTIRLDVLR